MKKGFFLPVLIMALVLSSCSSGEADATTKVDIEQEPTVETTTTEETEEVTETSGTSEETEASRPEKEPTPLPSAPEDAVIPEGYEFVWSDEFDGKLEDNWTKENHQPGYVNNELQMYTTGDNNVFIEDGCLVIQPLVTEKDGKPFYTSGRINSYHKNEFKYGYIEARIRTPEGKGYLPAFWMLPTTGDYGGWPSSGEIDIMEVVGGEENKTYSTLHFGNPHDQNQGTFELQKGRFCDDFHVYACEWEPGKMTFYVDGEKFRETSDWFSSDGGKDYDYPAPFNTPFYIILNVAVGGDWPGSPDDDTPFDERGRMTVDYVRVYQKDSYDETNIKKPDEDIKLRKADENGNFITADWKFYQNEGGKGSAEIKDEIIIKTEDEGKVDYSIQLVNEGIPLKKDQKYTFTFEAKASAARKMIAAITGPDHNYTRYFGDQEIELTDEWQTYSFSFTMNERTDANSRVEFNMGATGTPEDIFIRNAVVSEG